MSKEKEFTSAIEELQKARAEGVNLLIDIQRRRALYPDLPSMEPRTRAIMFEQAALPVNEADSDIMHLLYHIDMLKKALREKENNDHKRKDDDDGESHWC